MARETTTTFLQPNTGFDQILASEPAFRPGGGTATFGRQTIAPGQEGYADLLAGAANYSTGTGIDPGYLRGLIRQRTGVDPLTSPLTREYVRYNAVGGLGQIPGLRTGGLINETTNLNDLVSKRAEILGQSNQRFSQLLDQSFGSKGPQGFESTGLGRFALLRQLEQKFGPAYRSNPEAQGILKQFDAQISQKADIGTLQELIAQGKTALDFIKDPSHGPQFAEIIRLGDQILRSSGVNPSSFAGQSPEAYSFFTGGGL